MTPYRGPFLEKLAINGHIERFARVVTHTMRSGDYKGRPLYVFPMFA